MDKYATGIFNITTAACIVGNDTYHLRRDAGRRHHVIAAHILDVRKMMLCRKLRQWDVLNAVFLPLDEYKKKLRKSGSTQVPSIQLTI